MFTAIEVKAIVDSIVCTYYNWIRDASKSLFHTIVHAVHSAFCHICHDTWCSIYLPWSNEFCDHNTLATSCLTTAWECTLP